MNAKGAKKRRRKARRRLTLEQRSERFTSRWATSIDRFVTGSMMMEEELKQARQHAREIIEVAYRVGWFHAKDDERRKRARRESAA